METERRLVRPHNRKIEAERFHVLSLFRRNRGSEDLGVEGEHSVVCVPFADDHDLPGLTAVGNHPYSVAPRLQIMTLERDGLRELDPGRDVGSGSPDRVPIDDTPEVLSEPPGSS